MKPAAPLDTPGSGMKRQLPPFYTEDVVPVPHLRQKLKWLYSHHPRIKRQYHVAHGLNVSAATLSSWLSGKKFEDSKVIGYLNPESIPVLYYPEFLKLWDLPSKIMAITDMERFKDILASRATLAKKYSSSGEFDGPEHDGQAGPWYKLLSRLPDHTDLKIVPAYSVRGVVDPQDRRGDHVPCFPKGSDVVFKAANPGFEHGVMLLEDRLVWECLQPHRENFALALDEKLIFPRQDPGENHFATLDEVGGPHRLVAIFTRHPLPEDVRTTFASSPLDLIMLDALARAIGDLADEEYGIFARNFVVI